MTVFTITRKDRKRIDAAKERARAKPVPWEAVAASAVPLDRAKVLDTLALEDRNPEAPERPRSEFLKLAGGYVAAVSYERQPAGLFMHLSVSSPVPGLVPHPLVLEMVLEAFGMLTVHGAWVEEFAPGQQAVNFLMLVEAMQ